MTVLPFLQLKKILQIVEDSVKAYQDLIELFNGNDRSNKHPHHRLASASECSHSDTSFEANRLQHRPSPLRISERRSASTSHVDSSSSCIIERNHLENLFENLSSILIKWSSSNTSSVHGRALQPSTSVYGWIPSEPDPFPVSMPCSE